MKTNYLTKLPFILTALLITIVANAQDNFINNDNKNSLKLFNGTDEYRTWSIGISGGALMPISAFGGRDDFSNWESNFGYGINVTKQISHMFGVQADFLGGTISANNDRLWNGNSPVNPYKSFKTDINWAASLNIVATLGNINWSAAHTAIKPYLSLGVGSVNYTPHLVKLDNTNYNPDGDNSNLYIPFGLGAKAHLNQNINLVIGYKIGVFDGDNLDGYFKEPYFNDRFSFAHIGIEFSLGNKNKPQLARYNPPRQLYRYTNDHYMNLKEQVTDVKGILDEKNKEVDNLKKQMALIKLDTDGDGVSDYFDRCPNTSKGIKVDGSGCNLPQLNQATDNRLITIENNKTVITQEDLNVMSDASVHLEFELGKATLKPESYPSLHRVVDILMRKDLNIKLIGHTDNIGSEAKNRSLSKARAESVKAFLIKNGIHEDHISTEGFGSQYPIASNKTTLGRKKNRRVEFTVY